MPEISANTKIILGVVAATAALFTGLLGNVLSASISAFFSGRHRAMAKRPAFIWILFFVSAAASVVAGSVATFAPAPPTTPTPPPENKPKIVVTNSRAVLERADPKDSFFICRDTVQIANTSDVPTSVVAVGTELQVDNTVIELSPTDRAASGRNDQVAVIAHAWRTAPAAKKYQTVRFLSQFTPIQGDTLPVRAETRSVGAVYIDMALKFTSGLSHKVSATHVLRFPDIEDVKTGSMECAGL
jgi:hypothetical protein